MIAKNTSNIFTPLDVLPRDFKHFINMQKEADNAATKKIRDLERQGKTHNENARVPTKRKETQLRGGTY